MTTIPTMEQALSPLTTLSKEKNWVRANLTLTPSSKIGRFFWHLIGKLPLFDTIKRLFRKVFYGVDLEQSKRTLISIKNSFEKLTPSSSADLQAVKLFNQRIQLYNDAAAKFNLVAPRHSVPLSTASPSATPPPPLPPQPPLPPSSFPPSITAQEFERVRTIASTPINNGSLVCFYKGGLTRYFGNFSPCTHLIKLKGLKGPCTFRSAEAAFQWGKFTCFQATILHSFSVDLSQDVKFQELMERFFHAFGEEAWRCKVAVEEFLGLTGDNVKNAARANYFKIQPAQYKEMKDSVFKGWDHGTVNPDGTKYPPLRDECMWRTLLAKCESNPDFCELLSATGQAYLLEHSPKVRVNDYWSDGGNGSGANMLGQMLMSLRDALLLDPNLQTDITRLKDVAKKPTPFSDPQRQRWVMAACQDAPHHLAHFNYTID